MIESTIYHAVEKLINVCPGIYTDLLRRLHNADIKESSFAYESHGAVILNFNDRLRNDWHLYNICDSGNSDMISAVKEAREAFQYDLMDEEVYFLGEIPQDYDVGKSRSSLKFICTGAQSKDIDLNIHLLSESDREQVNVLTALSDGSDNEKFVAECIKDNFDYSTGDSAMKMLGIFDGNTLAGAVSVTNRNIGLIYVNNIFVSRVYRGRKYSTCLLRAAMSLYPDVLYSYTCAADNTASKAAAESAGFEFAGTWLIGW
jgi:hypothetical protein